MKTLLNSHNDKSLKDLECEFAKRLNSLDISVIDNYALTCDARLLPFLASAYQVDIAELSEHEARSLINDALSIHFRAGSVWAMKKLLKTFSEKAQLFEWFEYNAKPNHFKVKLFLSNDTSKVYSDAKLKKYKELINKTKNIHSVLDGFEILLNDIYMGINIGSAGVLCFKQSKTTSIRQSGFINTHFTSALKMNLKLKNHINKNYKIDVSNLVGFAFTLNIKGANYER